MRQITMSTTQRNQVTIPAAVRRLLSIEPRDKVCFTIEDGGAVRLTRAPFTLESAYGSVVEHTGRGDFDDVARTAKDAKALETIRELNDGNDRT